MGKIDNVEMFTPLSDEELAAMPELPPGELLAAIVPVPEDAPPMKFKHPVHGEPTGVWPYFDRENRLIGYRARFDHLDEDGNEDRTFFPMTFCRTATGMGWRAHGFPAPCSLYKLPEIYARSAAPILVCQGEKTASGPIR